MQFPAFKPGEEPNANRHASMHGDDLVLHIEAPCLQIQSASSILAIGQDRRQEVGSNILCFRTGLWPYDAYDGSREPIETDCRT